MITLNESRSFPAILQIPGVTVCDKGSLSLLVLTARAIFLAAPEAILCIRVDIIMRHGLDLKGQQIRVDLCKIIKNYLRIAAIVRLALLNLQSGRHATQLLLHSVLPYSS